MIGIAMGVIAIAVLLLYAVSDDALQRFYLPAASGLLGARIEAEGLDVGLGPTIGLRHFELVHTDSGIAVSGNDLWTHWSLGSFLGGGIPRLVELRLSRLQVSVPERAEDEDRQQVRPEPRNSPWIPVAIDLASIDLVELSIRDREAEWLIATLGPVVATHLVEGRPAHLGSPAELRFSASRSGRRFRMAGNVEMQLEQSDGGRALNWEIHWPVSFTETPDPASEAVPLAFEIDQSFRGLLTSDSESTHSLRASARGAEHAAGTVRAELHIGPPPPENLDEDPDSHRRALHLRASGEDLRPALVNPLLAAIGPEALHSGELNGEIELALTGDVIGINSEISGTRLRLAANSDHGVTPALNLQLVQEATLRRERQVLEIERSSLRLSDAERLLVRADLTAPLHFEFDDGATTGTSASPVLSGVPDGSSFPGEGDAVPARLDMNIDQIEIDRLRPWTAVWGSTMLRPVRSGLLSGNLTAELAPSAHALSVRGDLRLKEILFEGPPNEADRGPFTLDANWQGRSSDLSSMTLESLTLDIGAARGPLARLDVRGSTGPGRAFRQGRGTLVVPDVPFSMTQLGLIHSESLLQLVGGDLRLEFEAERAKVEETTQIRGDLLLRELRIASQGREMTRSAYTSFSGRIPTGQNRIETLELVLQATDFDGQPAGTMSAGGYWPLRFEDPDSMRDSSQITGKVGMKLRGLDLLPWLELFGYRSDNPDAFPWPASADVTLTVDARGENFTIEGEERVGPIQP